MRTISVQSMVFFLFFIIVILSCDNSELERTQSELKKANERINEIESDFKEVNEKLHLFQNEKQKLSNEITVLRRDIQKLKIENQLLSGRSDELNEWSKTLVDGYGPGIWYIGDLELPIFVKPMRDSDVRGIVKELNKRFEKDQLPKINLVRISKKTAHIKVDDPYMLTQKMGTHGAASYMNAIVYSLASIENINCVWFEFEEGDHAFPGKYCR